MSNELTISKANSFVEASYAMTLDEVRVLSLTLGVFDPTNPTKRGFDFTVEEFCEHFPEVDNKSAYAQVQNAIRKISKRWITLVDNEKELTEVALLHKRTYFKKEGRFYIEFHEELMPYISNLHKNYTKYQLVNIGLFTSTHTIRLYELCSQYKKAGGREINLNDLKDWLQIKNKYTAYADFRKWVLEPAIKEINAKSDLLVGLEPIKRGRTIHALKFTIAPKKKRVSLVKKPKETVITDTKQLNPVQIRGKLPQRPPVRAGSTEEGDYFRKCENQIRLGWRKYFKIEDSDVVGEMASKWREALAKLPTSELQLLYKYNKATGNETYKRIKRILDDRGEIAA